MTRRGGHRPSGPLERRARERLTVEALENVTDRSACRDCDAAAGARPRVFFAYLLDGARIGLVGCVKHVDAAMAALNVAQRYDGDPRKRDRR